jgi:hypothetical protein
MKSTIRVALYCILIAITLSTISCKKEKPVLPVITTIDISALTVSSASSGGIISSDGGAAVTYRGVCWGTGSSPTIADNKTTGAFLGDLTLAGGKLKETGLTHWITQNTGATNETGFTALPAGARGADGPFSGLG